MPSVSLYERLVAGGARPGEYCGAPAVAAFADVAAEFAALRDACGVFCASWHARFVVTGPDRVRWLNGMVTNNIRDLETGRGAYCFVLNPQGRIQGDLYCWNRGDYLLLETDQAQAPRLHELFVRYIVMDDVEITDISGQLVSIGLSGAAAAGVLARCGMAAQLAPLELRDQSSGGMDITLARTDAEVAPEFELWMLADDAPAAWDALTGAGAQPAGSEAYEMLRVWSGRPRMGADIRERDLPQETGQQRALNFSKGCYVGQEIVERIRSRGQVHRQFTGFILEGSLPVPGLRFQAGDRDVAELTSVAEVPGELHSRMKVALGYARGDMAAPGTLLESNGTRARVTDLPFRKDMHV
ncbi:MAG: folate-binding protein YgfZ [Acidobacteria bacterium]|nr:folate-binding protein YgfZ [Acidobacteriota bacterium]